MLNAALLLASLLGGAVDAPPQASAEPPTGHFALSTHGRGDGLSDAAISRLIQDSRGDLWAATDDGAFRFDGSRFERFGKEQGLPSNTVTAICEDASGRILVGTSQGLARFAEEGFRALPMPAPFTATRITAIATSGSRLWVGTETGLLSADGDAPLAPAPAFTNTAITAMVAHAAEDELWVAAKSGTDAWLDRWHDGAWGRVNSPDEAPNETINAVVVDGTGQVWARTRTQLWRLDAARDAFERVTLPVALNSPGGLAPAGRDDLWVPNNADVLLWDGQRWMTFVDKAYDAHAVLEDADGSTWIASRRLQRIVSRRGFRLYDRDEGLPGAIVWSVFRDDKGTLFVGTDDGLAYSDGRRFWRVRGTEGFAARSIAQSGDTLFIAGTPVDKVLRINRRTLSVEGALSVASGKSTKIFRLALDRAGALWASTDFDAVLKVDDPLDNTPLRHVDIPGMGREEAVTDLALDQQDRLLVAAKSGLYVLDRGQWRRFTSDDGLLAAPVAYARPLSRDGDWVIAHAGAFNAVSRLSFRDGQLRVLDTRHYSDRLSDRIFLVAQDLRGALWIGTGYGIDRVDGAAVTHYGVPDGIAGEDISSMAFWADTNGDVWFGAINGLTRFDAARHAELPIAHPPRVVVRRLVVGGEAIATSTTALVVPHSRNALEVRLGAPSFLGAEPVQYQVQLIGIDPTPVVNSGPEARYPGLDPGRYLFKASARVPPGAWGAPTTIDLTVKAPWWDTLWARLLFAVALVLLVIGLVRARTMRLQAVNTALEQRVTARTEELRQANQALTARNDELHTTNHRLAETQQQLIQAEKMATVGQLAAGVAHEINNPIGFVQSNLSTLSKYIDAMWRMLDTFDQAEVRAAFGRDAIEVIKAARERLELDYIRGDCGALLEETSDGISRVRRIVEDLKNFSRLDNPEWQSVDIHTCIESAIKLSAHEVKYKAEIVREFGQIPAIHCLPFQLNQVFLNLLVNAAQAIPQQGVIRIRTSADIEGITIEISDDGCGIPQPVLARIFDPFYTTKPIGQGTGLGLSVSYGIIARHHGRIEVASEPDQGTTFRIWLPLDAREQEDSDAA